MEELIDGLEEGSPNLRPRKRMELGPFVGTFAVQSRRLNAHFAYNRRFEVTQDRHAGGSWTRQLHPDVLARGFDRGRRGAPGVASPVGPEKLTV